METFKLIYGNQYTIICTCARYLYRICSPRFSVHHPYTHPHTHTRTHTHTHTHNVRMTLSTRSSMVVSTTPQTMAPPLSSITRPPLKVSPSRMLWTGIQRGQCLTSKTRYVYYKSPWENKKILEMIVYMLSNSEGNRHFVLCKP